jgi:hypothetical protein
VLAVWAVWPLLDCSACTWLISDCRSVASCCSGVTAVVLALEPVPVLPALLADPAADVPEAPDCAWTSSAWMSEESRWNAVAIPLAGVAAADAAELDEGVAALEKAVDALLAADCCA